MTVFGQEMPISIEAFMLAVAEKMGLPGFGLDGFSSGQDFRRPEDLYLRMVANIALGEKPDAADAVPEASDEEERIFLAARQHLPRSVFDLEKWKAAVGSHCLDCAKAARPDVKTRVQLANSRVLTPATYVLVGINVLVFEVTGMGRAVAAGRAVCFPLSCS